MTEYKNFEKLDIRVGKIIEVNDFPEAKKIIQKKYDAIKLLIKSAKENMN